MHARTSDFAALPLPRHAAQAAADLAAKHTAMTGLRSPDRGRSGPCFRHQRGSLGPFFVRAARPAPSARSVGPSRSLARARSARAQDAPDHLPVQNIADIHVLFFGTRTAGFLVPAGAWRSGLIPGKGSCEDASSKPAAGDLFCADPDMRLFFRKKKDRRHELVADAADGMSKAQPAWARSGARESRRLCGSFRRSRVLPHARLQDKALYGKYGCNE